MEAVLTQEIARAFGISEADMMRDAIRAWLEEKKRQVLQARLEILSRYGAISLDDLEKKIADGAVPEHPAWEDLITAENLTHRLRKLDEHLARL